MPPRYTPLDTKRLEIRTLTLFPGQRSDPIHCSLQTVSLDEDPKYHALSYVWGDDRDSKDVVVDGEVCKITINLDAALRRLRYEDGSRVIWADALCINQTDVDERNKQVPLMGKVYARASDVFVWLGESTPSIDACASYLQDKAKNIRDDRFESDVLTSLPETGREDDVASSTLDSSVTAESRVADLHQVFCGTLEILAFPYWSRMWTFQEYLLAANEPVLLCGETSFSLKSVVRIWEEIDAKELNEEWYTWYYRYETNKETISVFKIANALGMYDAAAESPDNKCNLDYLLHVTSGRKCSDLHDKIYALYGVATETRKALPPDYNKPMDQVLMETICYLHSVNNGAISPLVDEYFLRSDRLENRRVPSWIPDLETPAVTSETEDRHFVLDKLCTRILNQRWNIRVEGQQLHCKGRSLGPIKLQHRFPSSRQQLEPYVQDVMNILTDTNAFPDWSKEKLSGAFRTTHYELTGASLEDILYILKHAVTSNVSSRYPIPNLFNKVLFSVQAGLFGLSHGIAKDGDILALIPHLSTKPLLLRCEPECMVDKSQCRCRRLLVGHAYVSGIVDDDCYDDRKAREISQMGSQMNL